MVTDKKFTKGKWIIKAQNCFLSDITTEDGVRIAETKSYGVGFNDATEKEQKANAKLIAAAPELFEVSLMAFNLCNRIMNPTNQELKELKKLALSAIKKATE